MGHTPLLPDATPHNVNDWEYDPDPYNGNAWFGPSRDTAVFVYPIAVSNETALWVKDERVSGYNHVELLRSSYDHTVDLAVDWMTQTHPHDWQHRHVCTDAFTPPTGWTLERYILGSRRDTITYSREQPPENCRKQVLQIQGYRSTGNYEFGVVEVPTERAGHTEDVVDETVPKGSSLEVALAMAFEHASDRLDQHPRPIHGQATLNSYQRIS
jgi:hypothetical protein